MTAPQSASETDTQPGPNSDDLNTAAPFPFLIINFLASYYKIGQQDGRMLMHAARVYDLKDSEALRWAKVVQQAENFCHNRNGEHKWHWAKDKADDFLIRAYEAWPDLKMHERLCRGKMALGGVATFFQYTGTQTEAQTALEDFIRTGIIPAPKPVPEATKEAMRLEGIAKRSAELETGEAELDKWFGPKKVSKAVTDSSNGKILGDYLKTQQSWGAWWTSAKNLCKANGIEDDKAQEAHIHEILLGPDYGDRSAKTYPGTPGDALGAVKDSFSKPKTKASENATEKPASAPVASTPAVEPAKDDKPQAQDIPAVETTKQEVPEQFEIDPFLSEAKTLMGIPATRIQEFINRKYEPWAYSGTRAKDGGDDWTVIDPLAVRARFDKIFGPHGIGWRILPVPNASSTTVTPFTQKTKNGERAMYQVTLSGYYMEYRIRLGDSVEWQRTSAFTDSDDNDDLGYSGGGAFTGVMKMALKMLGGYDHFMIPAKKAKAAAKAA